jgi:hypothetical protein
MLVDEINIAEFGATTLRPTLSISNIEYQTVQLVM